MKNWAKQWFSPSGPGDKRDAASFPWLPLVAREQLEMLGKKDGPLVQVVFKHSTRCGLSAMMLRRFEATWADHRPDTAFYLLDLVRYRELSDALADRFELRHQSPQVMIISQGVLVASASHGDIADLKPGDYQK